MCVLVIIIFVLFVIFWQNEQQQNNNSKAMFTKESIEMDIEIKLLTTGYIDGTVGNVI